MKQILNKDLEQESITVCNLQKHYTSAKVGKGGEKSQAEEKEKDVVKAVQGVSFSLKDNECFVLLGVNGAGKTSTFKCLTLEEILSSGQI